MSQNVTWPPSLSAGEFFVPGTCFVLQPQAEIGTAAGSEQRRRDRTLRNLYLTAALADVPRLLGAIDRNPYRPTYGCLDRQFWHYRTASFPSQMYQEGALPLALVYATKLPGNRWHGDRRVRELAVAAIRFAARSSHADGSCDDYYPFERALGAAVFSLAAAAEAYRLLDPHDEEILAWFERRCRWLIRSPTTRSLARISTPTSQLPPQRCRAPRASRKCLSLWVPVASRSCCWPLVLWHGWAAVAATRIRMLPGLSSRRTPKRLPKRRRRQRPPSRSSNSTKRGPT